VTTPSRDLEGAIAAAEVARRLRLCDRYEAALREIAELPHVDAGYGPGIAVDALADPEYVDSAAIADAMGEHEFAEMVRQVRS
jgi:hypothetical protein